MVKLQYNMKKPKIDAKDRKILYELDLDARQSFSEIGKKVGLSKEVVNYRIKQMEKKGIIKGYHTIMDMSRLGYLSFRFFIRLHNTTIEKEKEIVSYLVNHKLVGWLVSCHGNWDINMWVNVKTVGDFNNFFRDLMEKYQNYFAKKWVSVFIKVLEYKQAYLVGKKMNDLEGLSIITHSGKASLDEMDWRILKLMSKNARIQLLDLANKLGVTAKAVSYRIKKLINEKVILGYRVILDLGLLGYQYHKVHLSLKDVSKKRLKDLMNYAKVHPNVLFVDEMVGGADFETEFHVESTEQLYEILDDLRNRFADIIDNVETVHYTKEYKFEYFPG